MVNLQILLAVLRAGRCSDRLLRFWEARNLRKGGDGSMRRGQVCEVDGWRENCCPGILD
ncbi:unnamed protein product [Brassica oleracea var. botrytis]|uniref:(rape) hypothetical protein n=1 Tax=Brassica napus TaxID=3708 RepID=A0A816J9D8_BRANA|nr:unnamed protein product [Brassica napus]